MHCYLMTIPNKVSYLTEDAETHVMSSAGLFVMHSLTCLQVALAEYCHAAAEVLQPSLPFPRQRAWPAFHHR